MKARPVHEAHFYHDGNGPEFQSVVWGNKGETLIGVEYYNPDDIYDEKNRKNICTR
jgi:hypothetical protein